MGGQFHVGPYPKRARFRHGWSVSCGIVPGKQRFRHGWRKYHRVVPGKQRFQSWVVSFMWGRTRKGLVSGTGGGNTIGSCPESNVFSHGWSVSCGVVPEKGSFQARVEEIPWDRARKATFSCAGSQFHVGRARKATFSGTGRQFHVGSYPESNVFRHGWSVSCGACPKSNVFRHGWRKYHRIVPGKQRFQARVGKIP